MTRPAFNFADADFVARYVEKGPRAFMPGQPGVLQMAGVLLAERVPDDGHVLVVGAGGGLDTQALAKAGPGWRFTGVDPSADMLAAAATRIAPHALRCLTAVSTAPRRARSTAPPAC